MRSSMPSQMSRSCRSTAEDHTGAVLAGLGNEKPLFAQTRRRRCGIWIRTPAPSAGLRIAAAARVRQIQQDLYALEDDVVALVALDAGYKANAAGVVLMARVVQALRPGKP